MEQGLVRARGAACHHHAVQAMFFDLLGDVPDAVLRAGVEVVFGMNNMRQPGGKLGHLGYIQIPAYVRPTVTYKDTHAGFLPAYIALGGKFDPCGQGEACRAEQAGNC